MQVTEVAVLEILVSQASVSALLFSVITHQFLRMGQQ